jgi:HSP20 family protein
MNFTVRKNTGIPSLLADFFSPSSVFDNELFDADQEVIPARLGINLPATNISEGSKDYLLELAAPGLDRADFVIEIDGNSMTIKAEKEEEFNEEREYSRKEYSFNSFCRTFMLPDDIREDHIEAKYVDGILRISIPKRSEAPEKLTHRIDVS